MHNQTEDIFSRHSFANTHGVISSASAQVTKKVKDVSVAEPYGDVVVKEPTCTGNGVTEVGKPLLFPTTFTFLNSEGSWVPILLLGEQRVEPK